MFDISLAEGAAKGLLAMIVSSIIGANVARVASQVLIGWIPIIGNAVNTTTAAGITEMVGWLAVEHFYNEHHQTEANSRVEASKAKR
ncbi:MAG: hypothetical protein LBJ36_03240 [Synergistaceae bacterium]|nr:hypothetical protein [Synergistaceae bacterium]